MQIVLFLMKEPLILLLCHSAILEKLDIENHVYMPDIWFFPGK